MNGCSLFTALWDVLEKEKRSDIMGASKGVIFDRLDNRFSYHSVQLVEPETRSKLNMQSGSLICKEKKSFLS